MSRIYWKRPKGHEIYLRFGATEASLDDIEANDCSWWGFQMTNICAIHLLPVFFEVIVVVANISTTRHVALWLFFVPLIFECLILTFYSIVRFIQKKTRCTLIPLAIFTYLTLVTVLIMLQLEGILPLREMSEAPSWYLPSCWASIVFCPFVFSVFLSLVLNYFLSQHV
jgi:hypothetical protein